MAAFGFQTVNPLAYNPSTGNGGTTFGSKSISVPLSASDFPALVAFAQTNEVCLHSLQLSTAALLSSSPKLFFSNKGQSRNPGTRTTLGRWNRSCLSKWSLLLLLHLPVSTHSLFSNLKPQKIVGIPVFGPSLEAAKMEGSKTFSKDFMAKHSIPTSSYRNFTDHASALAYINSISHRIVIKASGLAAGKGVIIPLNKEEAIAGLTQCMLDKEFGSAGDEVVIEEFMEGQELSILAFSDGFSAVCLPGAQDHKRIGEGDTGLNTGGMGVYAPAPCSTKEVEAEIFRTIVQPTIDGMRKDG